MQIFLNFCSFKQCSMKPSYSINCYNLTTAFDDNMTHLNKVWVEDFFSFVICFFLNKLRTENSFGGALPWFSLCEVCLCVLLGLPWKNLLNENSSESVNMSALIFQLKLVPKLYLTGSKISSENYFNYKRKRAIEIICSNSSS